MAAPQTGTEAMPLRNDRLCPRFEEDNPGTLVRYFDDLEALFARYRVDLTDPTIAPAVKAVTVRYADFDTEQA